MDGLECSEINLSALEFTGRIDSEYYQKKFLKYEKMVLACNSEPMGELCHFLIGPFGSAYDTNNYVEKSDFRYVRGQDVKPFFLQDTSPRFMAKDDFTRLAKYELKENDILVSVVGTLGNACIIQKEEIPAIFSCKSTAVRVDKIEPYFLLTYLNSKYGRQLLLRKERGAIQKGLNLDDLKVLDIPFFSYTFQKKVQDIAVVAPAFIKKSNLLYSEAHQLLMDNLHFNPAIISTKTITEKQLSESFNVSGRLDAEYYQPKYESYYALLKKYNNGVTTIGDAFSHVKTKCSRNELSYHYVEIGDIDVGSGTATNNKVMTKDLPANAKIMTKKGDILISTVRPNRGAVAILDEGNLLVSGAFTVLREKGCYRKEILQLLLRTELYRDWLLKYNVGTSYPVIKDEDVLNMIIPLFSQDIQEKIVDTISSVYSMRKQAHNLIATAVRAVEIAIEKGENEAMTWLNDTIQSGKM